MSRKVSLFFVRHIELVLVVQGLVLILLAYFVVGPHLTDRWRFTALLAALVLITQGLAAYFVRTQQRLTRQRALTDLEAAVEELLRVEMRWLLAQLSGSESHSAYEVEKVRYLLRIADYASAQLGLVLNDPLRVKVPGSIGEPATRDKLHEPSVPASLEGDHGRVHLQSI